MNGFMEPSQITPPDLAFRKTGRLFHQMIHHCPVQAFRHLAIPHPIRVTQVVSTRWRGTANRLQGSRVHAQSIANVVQPNRVRDLGKQKAHHMAPWAKGSTLRLDVVLFSQTADQMPRNQVGQLFEDGVRMARWNVVWFCFHPLRVEDFIAPFQLFLSSAMG